MLFNIGDEYPLDKEGREYDVIAVSDKLHVVDSLACHPFGMFVTLCIGHHMLCDGLACFPNETRAVAYGAYVTHAMHST